jgi:hypothetical protein
VAREFDQHDIGIGSEAAIESVRQRTVFPAATTDVIIPCQLRNVRLEERLELAILFEHTSISDDPILRSCQIDMR